MIAIGKKGPLEGCATGKLFSNFYKLATTAKKGFSPDRFGTLEHQKEAHSSQPGNPTNNLLSLKQDNPEGGTMAEGNGSRKWRRRERERAHPAELEGAIEGGFVRGENRERRADDFRQGRASITVSALENKGKNPQLGR